MRLDARGDISRRRSAHSPQRRRWRRRSAQPAVRCWLALAAYWRRRSAQPAVRRWPAPAAAALAATLGPARSGVRRWRRRSVSPSPPAVAGSEARPSPQCGACGDSRRSSPSPSLARARVGGAGLYGAGRNARSGYTLPSQPAAVARDDARHARDRGTGGDARRWELTVALPGLRPQRRWRGEPATFGVALPACSGGGDARPSPRLRRWRQRSTHQLAVALPGPRPQRRRWRRRSAQLAVALPGPHPQRRRWRGDARCRPPRLQRWLGLHPPRTLPLGRGEPMTQARRGCGLTRM